MVPKFLPQKIWGSLIDLYCFVFSINQSLKIKGIRILYYHDIPSIYKNIFKAQMQFVKQNFHVISLLEAVEKLKNKEQLDKLYIVITFDDGYKSFLEISNYLLKLSLPASFFITVDFIGQPGYMTWDDIISLKSKNFNIGSHTISHPELSKCSKEKIIVELSKSKQIITNKTGYELDSLALPYGGNINHDIICIAMNIGYKIILTTHRGLNLPSRISIINNDFFILRRDSSKPNWNIKVLDGLIKGAKDIIYPQLHQNTDINDLRIIPKHIYKQHGNK